jgi:hypothetical protein
MTIAESQKMNTKMARLEQVNRWLNLVDELPLGHPDRLRFLAYAEQIIAGAVPEEEAMDREGPDRPRVESRRTRAARTAEVTRSPRIATAPTLAGSVWQRRTRRHG